MLRQIARGIKTRAPTGCPEVVLLDGARTPFLASGGDFAEQRPHDLQRFAIQGLLRRLPSSLAATNTATAPAAATASNTAIDKVVCGNVIHEVKTSNVAREAWLSASLDRRVPASSVTMACISSSAAIADCVSSIRAGSSEIALAGGVETMSDVPIRYSRNARRAMLSSQKVRSAGGLAKLALSLSPKDLLAPELPAIAEFSSGEVMGHSADRLCSRWGVSREEQDAFAIKSHHGAAKAWERGAFEKEVLKVHLPPAASRPPPGSIPGKKVPRNPAGKGAARIVERDNLVRGDVTKEKLASLRPAFIKPYGTVTAGNASALTDGASACILSSEEAAARVGVKPLCYVRDQIFVGNDPKEELLLGPAYALAQLLHRNGLSTADVDVVEFHEAFAGQVLANLNALDSDAFASVARAGGNKTGRFDMDKINSRGGSCSLGHPFGATGVRLLFTAANRLHEEDGQLAVIAACAAGGLGHAMLVERA